MQDLYEVLEVSPSAPAEVISAALAAQRRIWMHRQTAPTIERRQEAELRLAALAEAERVLLDPGRRATYDAGRAGGAVPATPPAPSPPTPPAPPPPTPTVPPLPTAPTGPPNPTAEVSGLDWQKTAKILNTVIVAAVVVGAVSLLVYRNDSSSYAADGYDTTYGDGYSDEYDDAGPGATTAESSTTTTTTPTTTTTTTTTVPATTTTAVAPISNRIESTVVRTCGSSGNGDCFLSVRAGPSSNSAELERLSEGETTTVDCQVTGEAVTSSILGAPTDVWVRSSSGGFMSAAFIDAGQLDPFEVTIPC